ncbi:uncharacterized protein [Montipora capricornis]|uniref:uncharacterized protein n=1 Tax=Montipora capricornis TaxID=246305 RepID=UPI0035F1FF08
MEYDNLDQQLQDIEEVLGKEMEQSKIQVTIHDLKDVYDKFQWKRAPCSEQRIAEGKVNAVAWTTAGQIQEIRAFVQRTPEAADKASDRLQVGPVELKLNYGRCEIRAVNFSVDLDSVYKTPTGDAVYALDKVDVDERNIWQLVIVVTLADGSTTSFPSKGFRIRTKPKAAKQDCHETGAKEVSLNGAKRKRQDSGLSSPSGASIEGSPHSVLTDYLEAQRARIENLTVVNLMETRKGDIAYHLNLTETARRRPDLEEGDVIAFLANNKTGQTEIEKLSYENSQHALMAGVISRSAYLNAHAPRNDFEKGATDTVCVIGLVKVKVHGTVQNGERVYVSLDKPGVAIPETQIPLRPMAGCTLTRLGHAMESKEGHSHDAVHLLQCFVSIVLGIQSRQIATAINNLQDKMQGALEGVMVEDRSRWLRGLKWRLVLFLVIAVVVTVVLYMFLAPGTWFQALMCKRGSIKGHTAYFEYVTYDHQYPKVKGIEFTWQKLMKKLDLTGCPKFNASGMHYYLNLARCEYFEKILLDHIPQIRGPEIFAVNSNCSKVYYVECDILKWTQYSSARNIRCSPSFI